MKKGIVVIVVIVLSIAGIIIWDSQRPKPPVYKSVLGAISLPHCPSCDMKLVPYSDCGDCGKKIFWESAEKAKEAIQEAGTAVDKAVEDLEE